MPFKENYTMTLEEMQRLHFGLCRAINLLKDHSGRECKDALKDRMAFAPKVLDESEKRIRMKIFDTETQTEEQND